MFLKVSKGSCVKKLKMHDEFKQIESLFEFLSGIFKIDQEKMVVTFFDSLDESVTITHEEDLEYFYNVNHNKKFAELFVHEAIEFEKSDNIIYFDASHSSIIQETLPGIKDSFITELPFKCESDLNNTLNNENQQSQDHSDSRILILNDHRSESNGHTYDDSMIKAPPIRSRSHTEDIYSRLQESISQLFIRTNQKIDSKFAILEAEIKNIKESIAKNSVSFSQQIQPEIVDNKSLNSLQESQSLPPMIGSISKIGIPKESEKNKIESKSKLKPTASEQRNKPAPTKPTKGDSNCRQLITPQLVPFGAQKSELESCKLTSATKDLVVSELETSHLGIMCDNCEANPITGKRFKCLTCPDYDLCYKCERKVTHEHPMIMVPKCTDQTVLQRLQKKFESYTNRETSKLSKFTKKLFGKQIDETSELLNASRNSAKLSKRDENDKREVLLFMFGPQTESSLIEKYYDKFKHLPLSEFCEAVSQEYKTMYGMTESVCK